MATSRASGTLVRQARPLLATTSLEAKRNVFALYKNWLRHAKFLTITYRLPKTEQQVKSKIKEVFSKNKDVQDIRVIDFMVWKGKQDLVECSNGWAQGTHIMKYWQSTVDEKPTDFLSKFLDGH